ncbi:MAG: radical SAM protein, partial [Veillonellaceae bacterium]|nr:radical SAM protein [Veillonellaceae bacterium]
MMDCFEIQEIGYQDLIRRLQDKVPDRRLPTNGSMEITFRCNLRCKHCYLGERRFTPPGGPGTDARGELTTGEIKRIIDEVAAAGCLRFLITGGEPFLRPDVLEIVQYAKKKGLLTVLYTNGTLLTQEIVEKLAEFPPLYLEITLYGMSQETYETVTGIPGSYARCMRGIELLKQHRVPFKLKTVVMTLNVHEFGAMQTFAENLGVRFRYDVNLNATLDHEKYPYQYRLSPADAVGIEQSVVEGKNAHLDRKQYTGYNPVDPAVLYQCGAGSRTFHIDPYGQLSPCMLARWQSYDLRNGSFQQGWSIFLKGVRIQKASNLSQCHTCQLRPLCTQCPAQGMLDHGGAMQPDSHLCQTAQQRAAVLFFQTHSSLP